jgi:hypothetical protein
LSGAHTLHNGSHRCWVSLSLCLFTNSTRADTVSVQEQRHLLSGDVPAGYDRGMRIAPGPSSSGSLLSLSGRGRKINFVN